MLLQGIAHPLFSVFDAVLGPIKSIGTAWTGGFITIAMLALLYSLGLTALYNLLMDKERYNEIKDRMEELKTKANKAKEEGNQEKSMNLMKKSMSEQSEFFTLQLKPMLATFLLAILIFPWLPHAFEPTAQLNMTSNGTVADFEGQFEYESGQYPVEASINNKNNSKIISFDQTEDKKVGDYVRLDGDRWQIRRLKPENDKAELKMALVFIPLPVSIPFMGKSLEALGLYILLIMPMSSIFRKLAGL